MTHLPYDICLRLRDAGLPQPTPAFGQIWLDFEGGTFHDILVVTDADHLEVSFYGEKLGESGILIEDLHTVIFHPDAEYLLDHLPDTLKIEKYEKQWMLMVKGEYQLKDTLLEAAALAYLDLHEKTPTL